RPDDGVRAEVRVPREVAVRRDRTAWWVNGGAAASFDVLGPTVLRLETWRPRGGDARLTVTLRGARGTSTHEATVGPEGDVRLPVDAVGPVEVTVRPSAGLWLVPSLRVPRGESR